MCDFEQTWCMGVAMLPAARDAGSLMGQRMISLNEDRTNARVDIAGDLGGADLELLIHQLANLRSKMSPAIPSRKPVSDHAEPAIVYDGASFETRVVEGGHCEFWVRHAGLGWVTCRLSPAALAGLRDFFIAATTREKPEGISLAYDDRTQTVARRNLS
jgi:hypothetical protein